MNYALLRFLGLIGAFAVGSSLPQLAQFGWLIRVGLVFMLFAVYLQIEPSRRMFHWSQLLSVLFGVLFATVGWAALKNSDPSLAKAFFFTAVTPTATAAPVIVGLIGGSIAYAVTTFMLSSLVISLALPFLIPIVIGRTVSGVVQDVLMRLAVVMVIPLVTATVIRLIDNEKGKTFGKKLAPYTFYAWIGLVVLITAQARAFLDQQAQIPWDTLGLIAAMSLGICVTNFVVGYLLGRPKFGLECSQALGQKNISFTVYLALTYADPLVALGPTTYVLWHNLWNAVQLYRYDSRKK